MTKRPNMTPRVRPNSGPATHALGLRAIVYDEMQRRGNDCDLNHLDISQVPSLDGVFANLPFIGDISRWDVAHMVSLNNTFLGSGFNGDISKWDTSNMQSMIGTFKRSFFTGDISDWNTSSLVKMNNMFEASKFNGDLSRWDTSRVTDMRHLFAHSHFQGDISTWSLANALSMESMFEDSVFSGDISQWRPVETNNTERMFAKSAFHGDLSQWRLPVWAKVDAMFSSDFAGILPRKYGLGSLVDDYGKMLGAQSALDQYLLAQPLNSVHVDLVLHDTTGKRPVWLAPQDHQWMEEQKGVLQSMACPIEESHGLLLAALRQRANPPMVFPAGVLNAMDL